MCVAIIRVRCCRDDCCWRCRCSVNRAVFVHMVVVVVDCCVDVVAIAALL